VPVYSHIAAAGAVCETWAGDWDRAEPPAADGVDGRPRAVCCQRSSAWSSSCRRTGRSTTTSVSCRESGASLTPATRRASSSSLIRATLTGTCLPFHAGTTKTNGTQGQYTMAYFDRRQPGRLGQDTVHHELRRERRPVRPRAPAHRPVRDQSRDARAENDDRSAMRQTVGVVHH